MRIAILHISDMHCKSDTTLKPASSLAACLREQTEPIDELIIAVTGDISFSGKAEEFEVAGNYLASLKKEAHSVTGKNAEIIVIPGNHDCSHPADTALRDIVLKSVADNRGALSSPSFLEQAVSVQENFFAWLNTIGRSVETHERIVWPIRITPSGGGSIYFLCVNSAWMSTLNEIQGRLFIPAATLPSPDNDAIVITLLHHPYNWFESNNARTTRQHIEAISDVVLTGHEHDAVTYSKTFSEGSVEYVEGGVFHADTDQEISDFGIIIVDTDARTFRAQRYSWTPEGYRTTDDSSSHSYVRASTKSSDYILKMEHDAFLRDLGAQFTHCAKTLEFEDLYMTPSLRRYVKIGTGGALMKQIIDSEQVIATVFAEKTVYFAGDGQSGKSSLSKHIYRSALTRGIHPVYIKGEQLADVNTNAVDKCILKAYDEQYSHPQRDAFTQLPPERKAIIIDDLPDSPLNREAKARVLDWIRSKHDYVFVFGGDFSHVEELLADMEQGQMVSAFPHYEIMEFGFLLRHRLIEKWLTLGVEHLADRETLAHRVGEIERLVDTVLGKNLLPAYPIFILSMLQQMEAGIAVNTKSGAYGYFYEALITAALQRTSRSLDDVDTKYTYLAEFAWLLKASGVRECDQETIARFNRSHWDAYRLTHASDKFLQEMVASRIIVDYGGRIGFRYKYLYYYFLARYIRDNLTEAAVVAAVDECVRDLHKEEAANVIIFLTYLSKDKLIMQKLLDAAKAIYHDVPPCNLETHIQFLNKLDATIPQIMLPDGDPGTARQNALRKIDEHHQPQRNVADTSGLAAESSPEELNQILTLNRALKSMQIMGQILRNFSGSLKGPIKRDLAAECFAVGLRTLNAYYGLVEKHLETMISMFADVFGKNLDEMSQEQRVIIAKRIVFALTEMLCIGVIKRISNAVGAEKLLPTYEDVQATMSNLATEFVQVGIRMDHSYAFPEKRVLDLHRRLDNNVFGQTLLRVLVANHFYMFPRSYKLRQRICEKLGIVQTPKMLLGTSEKKRRK
jgi:predicted MPP superfamily phosphohydrolase